LSEFLAWFVGALLVLGATVVVEDLLRRQKKK